MIAVPGGFSFSAVNAGIKNPETKKLDMGLILCDVPAVSCAMFTTNKVKAAPVIIGIETIKNGTLRAVFVNSGNANACTGIEGQDDVRLLVNEIAERLEIPESEIFPMSTGVIGVRLPVDRMINNIDKLISALGDKPEDFETALMTTDTFPKIVSKTAGKAVVLGFAKGSGMIAPNMATMLCAILTDARLNRAQLRSIISEAVENSFNIITVDGDMSTNDTIVALSSLKVEAPIDEVREAIRETVFELALMVARDGEGATKLVRINVDNAPSRQDAKKASMAVANSLLVKTAIFGADPNWGRICCALGYSGADINPDKIGIRINGLDVVEAGKQSPFFNEQKTHEALKAKDITIDISLGIGNGSFSAFTTDLSYDYVKINADYRS